MFRNLAIVGNFLIMEMERGKCTDSLKLSSAKQKTSELDPPCWGSPNSVYSSHNLRILFLLLFSFVKFRVSEKGGLLERGVFSANFLEILENLEILEILEGPPDHGKQRRMRPFSRDS